jgi:hypothetical protein
MKLQHYFSEMSLKHLQRLNFYEKFIHTVGKHPNMTNSSVQDIWSFFLDNAEEMSQLKVLESVIFFLGGKKCQKIVNNGAMRKD